jgi:hypothetical protein
MRGTLDERTVHRRRGSLKALRLLIDRQGIGVQKQLRFAGKNPRFAIFCGGKAMVVAGNRNCGYT